MPHPYDQDDDRILHEREMADQEEREFQRQRRAQPRLCGVTAYTVGLADRAYGGPEEGGWYFDTFEQIRVFVVPNHRAVALCRRLKLWCWHANKGRPDINSVLSEGRYVFVTGVEASYPTERPHYE